MLTIMILLNPENIVNHTTLFTAMNNELGDYNYKSQRNSFF